MKNRLFAILLLLAAGGAFGSEGAALPDSLRVLLPEYPDQKIVMAFTSADGDHVHLQIPADFSAAAAFYKEHFVSEGWTVELEMAMEDSLMLSLTEQGRSLGIISFRTNDASSSVSITLSSR